MEELIKNRIDFLMLKLQLPDHISQSGSVLKRKAGIWQGIDSYKDMDMYVIRNASLQIPIPKDIHPLMESTKPDMPWAESHFQERISGKPSNPGESYKIWPYAQFQETNDLFKKTQTQQFDHSYMERFWPKYAGIYQDEFRDRIPPKGQFWYDEEDINKGIRFDYGDYEDVITQLAENQLTRQAYLPIFFPEDTGAKNNMRVPCTLGYLFEIWDGKLDMTYYIRSCDAFRHFRNDIYMAGRLIQYTCQQLLINGVKDIEPGSLNMQIANLHIFENDLYPFKQKEKKIKNGTNQ